MITVQGDNRRGAATRSPTFRYAFSLRIVEARRNSSSTAKSRKIFPQINGPFPIPAVLDGNIVFHIGRLCLFPSIGLNFASNIRMKFRFLK